MGVLIESQSFFFFPFFLRCVFLYNPNFFQMLPTPPFQIFVMFFFLFCSGREEEEEEEDYDVCVCVCTPFLPCFRKGFVLLLPPLSPSSTRYSFPRSAPDNDDSFILFSFLFLMCTNRRKKEARERERERGRSIFFPSFYSLVYVHKICSSFLLDAGGRVGIL